MTRFLAFLRLLGQSAVGLSLGAASVANLGPALAGLTPSWRTAAIAFCSTYAVYNFDRLADRSGVDSAAVPERARALRAYRRWLWGSVLGALLVAVGLALTHSVLAVVLTLLFPLSVIAYVLPLLPFGHIRRLKDIPLLKSFYVPACWCIVVLLGIHIGQLGWLSAGALIALAFMFIRMLVSASVGDVRDYESDRQAGTQTLVVALGLPASYKVLNTLNAASLLALALAGAAGLGLGTPGLIPAVAIAIVSWHYFLRRPAQRELWCDVYDFELILCAPLVLLTAALF